MSAYLQPIRTGSDDHVEIEAFVELLKTGLLELHVTAKSLEHALSVAIAHNHQMDAGTLQALQSLDYSRQYSKDLLAIVETFGDHLSWAPGAKVSQQALVKTVDMKGTIAPVFNTQAPDAGEDQDIWL